MENLYIIIPAYNEEENIENVAREWHQIVENISKDSKLVIIDDGSKDRTYEKLCGLKQELPQLEPLTKPNAGHGATLLYGYNFALEQKSDYIFQTDSDGQTLPSEFQQFWDLRKEYDCIIGHRNHREDGISRIFVTKTLKLVLKVCFGVSVTDANTPFRLMSAHTLQENIKLIPKDYNLSNVMLSVIYTRKKQKIKYIPITFRPRQGGVNSINLKKIFGIGKKAVTDFRRINQNLKMYNV